MKISECNHIRIRDDNAYGVDVEEFIKSIEKHFRIDFRTLPQWKELVKRLHVMTTDCKRKIQDAKQRKYVMMSKLFIESTRDSPFELTDKLARTYNKWQMIESALKSRRVSLKTDWKPSEVVTSSHSTEDVIGEISENTSTAHQNTEIPDLAPEPPSKSDVDTDMKATDTSLSPRLPVKICMNQHKLISPLDSQDVIFKHMPVLSPTNLETCNESKEWLLLNQTKSVKCFPSEISITKRSINKQTIQFSIINCTTEYMNIRFMYLTDDIPFKTAKVIPVTPRKLYPGIAVTYKFIFKLFQNLEEFTSSLYFRVGQKVLEEAPIEGLCVPILSKFKLSRSVSVSKAVCTPPTYLWQINEASGFPSGTLKISCNDENSYHVHVIKRPVNISRECEDSMLSLEVISPKTESLIDRIEDNEIETQSKILSSLKDAQIDEVVTINTVDVIALVVDDIVDIALDTFVFDHSYLLLEPYSKDTISVYFTKPERIGSHHCYYDLEFSDTKTEELITTKTVKVFAEVLPHPIQICPQMLDLSMSPVTHGFCEDDIMVRNTHRLYPITIKIKLTTKMSKLFCITPKESLVPPKASMNFRVRLCSKDLSKESDDLAHFTIKIIVTGHSSVYNNVPPFYYEIIAPCASEFKKIYNEKYFIDTYDPFDKP